MMVSYSCWLWYLLYVSFNIFALFFVFFNVQLYILIIYSVTAMFQLWYMGG